MCPARTHLPVPFIQSETSIKMANFYHQCTISATVSTMTHNCFLTPRTQFTNCVDFDFVLLQNISSFIENHILICLFVLLLLLHLISKGVYGTLADFLYKKLVGSNKIPPPLTLKPATEEMVNCTIWGPTCDAVDLVINTFSVFFLLLKRKQT